MVLILDALCLNARLAFLMDLANDPIIFFAYRGIHQFNFNISINHPSPGHHNSSCKSFQSVMRVVISPSLSKVCIISTYVSFTHPK
jgi:hypothetical protein